jgi:hypothetical protein
MKTSGNDWRVVTHIVPGGLRYIIRRSQRVADVRLAGDEGEKDGIDLGGVGPEHSVGGTLDLVVFGSCERLVDGSAGGVDRDNG